MKLSVALLILSFILFNACNSKEKNVVDVGLLNGPSSVVMVQALEQLTYQDGTKVHYHIKDNPQHLRALLQSGNIDMAILPMTMAYSMIDNNINIKIFAITGWGNLFILSRDSINNLNDLKNNIIAVPGEGQTPDLVTKFLIDYLSLQEKISLNYTYPSPLLLTSALSIGKVQNAVLPEPLASLALSKDSTLHRSIDINKLWQSSLPEISLVQSVFVISGTFYDNNKVWFDAYVDSLENSIKYTIAHPHKTLNMAIEKELLPPLEYDTLMINRCHLDFVRHQKIAKDITRYLNTFYKLDQDFDITDFLIIE